MCICTKGYVQGEYMHLCICLIVCGYAVMCECMSDCGMLE